MENDTSLFSANSNNACLNFDSNPLNSNFNIPLSPSSHFISHELTSAAPMSSPPPPTLSLQAVPLVPFAGDQGFVERAARFSNFGLPLLRQFRALEPAVSDPLSASGGSGDGGGISRKRKALPLKTKTPLFSSPSNMEEEEIDAKRSKKSEETEMETKTEQKQGNNSNAVPPEPPKDYIHVRARRGQATDSHSLAERVRREKISERMKFLQDLVPGCSKVTGKAVMLDEIINYVQSLQRQVEFLSMKLASVNTRLDFNIENLLHKDVQFHQQQGSMVNPVYPAEAAAFSFDPRTSHSSNLLHNIVAGGIDSHCSPNSLGTNLQQSISLQSLNLFTNTATSRVGSFWEDDLHSVVQMGFLHGPESQCFQGSVSATQTKIEL